MNLNMYLSPPLRLFLCFGVVLHSLVCPCARVPLAPYPQRSIAMAESSEAKPASEQITIV